MSYSDRQFKAKDWKLDSYSTARQRLDIINDHKASEADFAAWYRDQRQKQGHGDFIVLRDNETMPIRVDHKAIEVAYYNELTPTLFDPTEIWLFKAGSYYYKYYLRLHSTGGYLARVRFNHEQSFTLTGFNRLPVKDIEKLRTGLLYYSNGRTARL